MLAAVHEHKALTLVVHPSVYARKAKLMHQAEAHLPGTLRPFFRSTLRPPSRHGAGCEYFAVGDGERRRGRAPALPEQRTRWKRSAAC